MSDRIFVLDTQTIMIEFPLLGTDRVRLYNRLSKTLNF